MRVILTEKKIRQIVENVLNEISPELKRRAFVKSWYDRENLDSENTPTAKNLNGDDVHRNTQKNRRERQIRTFQRGIEDDLSKKFNRNIKVSKSDKGNDTRFYGEIKRGGSNDALFHHYSSVNGDDSVSVYHTEYPYGVSIPFDHSDMKTAKELKGIVDGMAGYYSELSNGREYKDNIKYYDDRIEDVNNINNYNKELEDYEKEMSKNKKEIRDYNSKPWYKKIGKKKPQELQRQKPKAPVLKTGPYFMQTKTDGLSAKRDRIKQNYDSNKEAYKKYLGGK